MSFIYRLLLLICVSGNISAAVFSALEEHKVTNFVETVMHCKKILGLSLTIVKDGGVWSRGFGKTDDTSGDHVTNDTLFSIGSLGKAFTMVLLGDLIKGTE